MIAPLFGVKDINHFAPYLRMGPVNWTPRFDARFLDAKELSRELSSAGHFSGDLNETTSSHFETA